MSSIKPFVLGSLVGASVVYASLQYHLVRSQDGFYLVPRAPQASLGLAYADIRTMDEKDLETTPELARAMAAHSARELLAKNDATEPSDDGSLVDGSDMFDEVRDRLRSSTDWGDLNPAAIPKPPANSLDAPIWNPFNDTKTSEPSFDAFEEDSDDDVGAIPWPDDEPDPVAAQFEGDSPFADITDMLEEATADASNIENTVENVASELDEARDSFASRTRELADQFKRRQNELWPSRPGTKATTTNRQPTYTTNRVQAPTPAPSTTSRSRVPVPQPSQIPQVRDGNQRLRNTLNKRAREIYENARRRAAKPIDSLIDRAQSRADSVIDELVAPRGSSGIDALESASGSTPTRYTRGQR